MGKKATKKTTKKNIGLTELIVVLDKSGSMYSIASDTIGGFNTLLSEQRKLGKNIMVSLVLFNDKYELVHNGIKITDVPNLDDTTYSPSGSTALLDTVGRTINAVNNRIDATPKKNQPKKVIMAIITDGLENCSSDFSRGQIKDMIEHQKNEKKWEFVFIGANQDAFAEGGSMGVVRGSSCNFSANSVGVRSAYIALSAHTKSYRTGGQGVDMTNAYNTAAQNNTNKV